MSVHRGSAAAVIEAAMKEEAPELDFSGLDLRLDAVPKSIEKLTQIVVFRWQGAELQAFPAFLLRFTRLQELDLSLNEIGELPADIGKLGELRHLRLGGNKLHELPDTMRELGNLEELDLCDNRFLQFPKVVLSIPSLRKLDLTGNAISSLPTAAEASRTSPPQESLASLANLTDLLLADNKLSKLPVEIGRLRNLVILSLAGNALTTLPPELGQLSRLRSLTLDGNPWSEPIAAARRGGLPSLRVYLRTLNEERTDAIYEGKLLFVGEGGVGKTSLLAALRGQPFLEDRDTTHGVEISRVDARSWLPGGAPLMLNCWDMGGQEVYRITHQFFFSPRSLFLLLWSPRMSEDQCDVRGWIHRIKLRVGSSARIVVIATHCESENRVVRIEKESITREFGDMIVDFVEVDSKTGKGVRELQQLLARAALRLPQMGTLISPRWLEARDDVVRTNRSHLSMAALEDICRTHDLTKEEVPVFAQFLDQLGYAMYYGEDSSLKNEIILRPQWLAKAIGYVLEDAETNQNAGVLHHASLRRIWKDHGNPKFERYDEALHPYFLRLMEKFDVSYRLDDGKSLVAQLVPTARPDLPWQEDTVLADGDLRRLRAVCRMASTPPGLVPWLIVRTHRHATSPRRHWTRGLFLEYKTHGTALIELRDRDLYVEVRGSYPEHFMILLLDAFEQLAKERWPGLDYSVNVPCTTVLPDGRHCRGIFRLDALRTHLGKGLETFPCQECPRSPSIKSLLQGFDSRDDSVAEMVRKVSDEVKAVGDAVKESAARNSSQVLRAMRVLLAILNREVLCPRLFTVVPTRSGMFGRLFGSRANAIRLTLWCEYPEQVHPVCPIGSDGIVAGRHVGGEYVRTVSRAWLRRIAPYARAAAAILKWLPADSFPVPGGLSDLLKQVGQMERLFPPEKLIRIGARGPAQAEGAALRELHSFLLEVDPTQTWGGLASVLTAEGDRLWLCPEHLAIFEPGIPVIPSTEAVLPAAGGR